MPIDLELNGCGMSKSHGALKRQSDAQLQFFLINKSDNDDDDSAKFDFPAHMQRTHFFHQLKSEI